LENILSERRTDTKHHCEISRIGKFKETENRLVFARKLEKEEWRVGLKFLWEIMKMF
jgi:hypothetical protein